MFYFDFINNKKVMKSSLISKLEHFFTTRESIIKTKEDDFKELAEQNKNMFCEYFKVNNLISPSQTHTSNIEIVNVEQLDYPDTDGLILSAKNQVIYLNFADCVPIIFYDEIKNIGAIAHAGWRGTFGKIGVKTIQKLHDEFGTNIKNIKCAIGPAISFCCFNVGKDVCEKILSTVQNKNGLSEMRNDNIYVDLKGVNKQQLIEIGVKSENIDVCPYCTVCDNDLFFSYRKENATTNRHSAIIKL